MLGVFPVGPSRENVGLDFPEAWGGGLFPDDCPSSRGGGDVEVPDSKRGGGPAVTTAVTPALRVERISYSQSCACLVRRGRASPALAPGKSRTHQRIGVALAWGRLSEKGGLLRRGSAPPEKQLTLRPGIEVHIPRVHGGNRCTISAESKGIGEQVAGRLGVMESMRTVALFLPSPGARRAVVVVSWRALRNSVA